MGYGGWCDWYCGCGGCVVIWCDILVVVVGYCGVEFWVGYDLDGDVDCGWVGCVGCVVGCGFWYGGYCLVDWWCVGFGVVGDVG